jgi:hypothetical protein
MIPVTISGVCSRNGRRRRNPAFDDNVEAAEGVHGFPHDLPGVFRSVDREPIGDRLAAGLFNLVHDGFSDTGVRAFAEQAAAQIVDDELRAARGEFQRVCPAQATAGARNESNTPFQPDFLVHFDLPYRDAGANHSGAA